MAKKILSVGQCGPDHATLSRFLSQHFQAEVVPADHLADTLSQLGQQSFDLVLINRKLDADYSDGMKILKAIKSNAQCSSVPVMLVTNYAEHQHEAVSAGAVYGFGKLEYAKCETLERLAEVLGPPVSSNR